MEVEGLFGGISTPIAVVEATAGIFGIGRTSDCGFDPCFWNKKFNVI
jgi:hypothetical protein